MRDYLSQHPFKGADSAQPINTNQPGWGAGGVTGDEIPLRCSQTLSYEDPELLFSLPECASSQELNMFEAISLE